MSIKINIKMTPKEIATLCLIKGVMLCREWSNGNILYNCTIVDDFSQDELNQLCYLDKNGTMHKFNTIEGL